MLNRTFALALGLAGLAAAPALQAWDYEGHRIVNELALVSLPPEMPRFIKTPASAARIAFLAGEPDRWRNVPDLPLKQKATDHYCDLEQIPMAGIAYDQVPSLRLDFEILFAAGRAAHADQFPPIDETRDAEHARPWPGFAPWAITEYYGKLRSAFSYWKVFQELGSPEEVANAEANVIYLMGVMGHYVGDCAQPLHTTIHHNGWIGANPHGYTTWPGFHSWIDGGFIVKAGLKAADLSDKITPAQPISLAARGDGRDPMFVAVLDYLRRQNKLVEPLYQLEKAGQLGNGQHPLTEEGRGFISNRLREGGQELGAIWLTAWRSAIPDTYLRASLLKRQAAAGR